MDPENSCNRAIREIVTNNHGIIYENNLVYSLKQLLEVSVREFKEESLEKSIIKILKQSVTSFLG